METDILRRVQAGDLTGLNGLLLARLSNESKFRAHQKSRNKTSDKKGGHRGSFPNGKAHRRPYSGRDINNRDTQVFDMRVSVKRQGGKCGRTLMEEHTSAWKRRRMLDANGEVIFRVIRPVLDEALRILRAGVDKDGTRVDFLIVPDLDRLTRDPHTLEDIIDIVTHCGRPIIDPYGTLDLLTDAGRDNARGAVQHKHRQSTDTARRVRSKAAAIQRAGIPAGGVRPFGWRKDKRRLHKTEAPIYLRIIDDVCAHKTLHSIAIWLRDEGVRSVRGNYITKETLKAMLRNPRLCGYRAITVQNPDAPTGTRSRHMEILYQTKKVRDPETGKKKLVKVPIMGQWEALITPEKWREVLAIIGEKPGRGDGSNTRIYLGTGTFRCGNDPCECVMRAQKDSEKAGHYWYTCRSRAAGGCGGIRVDGPKADAYLKELVFAKYEEQQAKQDPETSAPEQWAGQGRLDRLLEDMAALRKARDKQIISAERYYQDLGDYEAKLSKLQAEQTRMARNNHARAALPINLPQIWDEMDLTEQRALVERVLSVVKVKRGKRGGRPEPVNLRMEPIETLALAA